MEDSARDISDCGFELRTFCEQVRVQMEKVVLNSVSADTEQEKRKQIPALQSIADTITRFCSAASDSQVTEMDRGNLKEEVEGESVETKGEVQERSDRVPVEGEYVTSGGKPATETPPDPSADEYFYEDESDAEEEAFTETEKEQKRSQIEGEGVVGGATETEEAPWFDIYHNGKSVTEIHEENFAAFRRSWEREWGNGNSFENLSLLSPMMFTHCSSIGAVVGRTLQVYSVKIAEIEGIQWPLKVYGVVAARDDVDKNRNPLFLRSRDNYQIVHQKGPFLQLTGPCRAIVSEEPVEMELQLRVNRGKKSDDKPLMSDVYYYNSDRAQFLGSTGKIENHLCKVELSYQQLEQSVQATFFGFHVGEPSPFKYGVKVLCSALSQGSIEDDTIEPEHRQVVMFDSRYGKNSTGNLNLSRQVVSVELQGKLGVLIQAYAPSGGIAAHGRLFITPKRCHTSLHTCDIGGSEVKFTVAWSLLLADKTLWLMNGYVDPFEDLPPFDPSLLEKLGISE